MTSSLGLINLLGKIPGSQSKQAAEQQVQISSLTFKATLSGGLVETAPTLAQMTQAPDATQGFVTQHVDGPF